MNNKALGTILVGLGASMIVGVFILGVLSFVNPSHLAGFAALMPGDSGLSAGVSYLIFFVG